MTSRQATSEYAKKAGPAVRKVTEAIKAGRLTRSATCEDCGGPGPIQGHHHNGYDAEHALDVVWLCQPCHRKRHGRRGSLPSWKRGARAYALATGRTGSHWHTGERIHSFGDWSMPKHLFRTMRHLWAALRTDEERAAMVALVNDLSSSENEGAA